MAKPTITPIELAQKYLIKIGVNKLFTQRTLLPSLFEDNILCRKMTTDNLVIRNKVGNKFTQTHLYINRNFWSACFTPAQEKSYKTAPTTANNQDSQQQLLVFEANISSMLDRRTQKTSPSVIATTPSQNYISKTDKLLPTSTYKRFNTQGSSIQVHMGIKDDEVFKDFRLGILLNDYLIMLKYANKDCILAISVPSEFCSKYNINGLTKINRNKSVKTLVQERQYEQKDLEYSTNSNSDNIKSEITPLFPAPAPSGSKTSASNKTKYHGKASRGKGSLEQAKYTCEFDSTHTSFVSEKTRKNYMEPHHLIPISKQGLYDNDIDITSNLVCLCPTCHKQMHYGTKTDIKKMLEKFHQARQNNLKACGIDIDLNTLFAYYDIY